MSKKLNTINLNELFGLDPDEGKKIEGKNKGTIEVDISQLVPFSNHPFKLYEGERLDDMVDSIKEYGVITPLIVRKIEDKYQILSGHNRANAAKIAGLYKVPVVAKEDITDEEAMLIVTETNLIQRSFSELSHSEKARILTEIHSAIKEYSELNEIENIIKRPNSIKLTEKQMDNLNLLNDFIVNYNIVRQFSDEKTISFKNKEDIAMYFKNLLGDKKDRERFMCAFLDKNNQLIKTKNIAEGTLNAAVIFPRELIKEVLNSNCKSVVLVHNHPSGLSEPSDEDIALTKNYVNILTPLKIKVLDHIVVGEDISSLRDRGEINDQNKSDFIFNPNSYNEIGKMYYENHKRMMGLALSNLLGIDYQKTQNYIEEFLKNNEILYRNDLFNTKLNLIGIEKISENKNDTLILNQKDILLKTLDYDASSISLVHLNSQNKNKSFALGKDLSQNIFNMLGPLQLKIIDYLLVTDNQYTSLKEKGVMPYTVLGAAKYEKLEIMPQGEFERDIENEEFYYDEEEWELEV